VRTGALSLLPFDLTPTFFGYKPEDSVALHDQLFEFVWMSGGKFDWDTVYHMPIFIRNFWIRKLNHKIAETANPSNKPTNKKSIAKSPF
jgi:hypothetical protein